MYKSFTYTTGMETKKLEIQQAVEWEAIKVKDVYTFNDFKKELAIKWVDDIFSSVKIKQDKEKYIFSMNNENMFAIDGKTNLVSWLQKYYEEKAVNEKRTEEQKVLIRMEWLELQYIKTKTKDDLNLLKSEITKTENLEKNATSLENVKYKLERNITLLEQEKEDISKRSKDSKIEKNLWKAYKSQLQERLDRLYKMKEEVELLVWNKEKKYTIDRENEDGKDEIKDVKMDDVNGMDMKSTLKTISERIEKIADDVPDFINTRNSIIGKEATSTPYFEIIINDKKDANDLKKSLNKYNKQYVLLNKISLDAAKKTEVAKDLEKLEEYLNTVIANPDTFKPSEHPFVPDHPEDFYKLVKEDETLSSLLSYNKTKTDISTDKAKNLTTAQWTAENATTGTAGTWTETNNAWATEYTASPYTSTSEAFEKWGIGGMIKYGLDQTQMKPEQKQFWWGVGNLAVMWWMIFVWWKMLSSAFKLLTKKGRNEENLSTNLARLGIPTALIMWSQMYSGEWPLHLITGGALTEKLAGVFGGKTTTNKNETVQDTETRLKYAEWFPWATAVFNGLNYGEMSEFLIQDGDKIKIDPDKYDRLIDLFENGEKKNEAAVSFLKSIGKDDDKRVMDLALTGMGIKSVDDLKNNPASTFNETASEAIVRLRSVTEYMEEHLYNKINPETQPLVDKYIASGKDIKELEDLDARGDVFYKETTLVDKTGLESQITTLAGDNIQRKQDLLLAINTFYDQMPNASKKIEITWTRPTITFKTYGQTSTINLENKELVGFTPSRFDSYAETFKAANLTNRIKEICKDKEAKSEKPFYLSTAGKDITFDDASLFSTSFDTEIMTAWWGGSLKKVSPTLDTYKQEYCDYLNTLKFRKTTTS